MSKCLQVLASCLVLVIDSLASSALQNSTNSTPSDKSSPSFTLFPAPATMKNDKQSPNSSTVRQTDSESNPTLIVSCIACLCIVTGLIFYVTKRREKKPPSYPAEEYAGLKWQHLQDMRIEDKEVQLSKHLSSGSMGDIYLGTYKEYRVAIKILPLTKRSATHVQRFIDEISVLVLVRCPFVVQVVGAAWSSPGDLKVVLEYMNLGDLQSFLERTNPRTFPFQDKLNCALNIARALAHIHNLDYIHRDVKSSNVLLDSKHGTKLGDFGVACDIRQNAILSPGRGTYRWMAPEMLTSRDYTTSVDIFSFGIILTELDTHCEPYSDLVGTNKQPLDDTSVLSLVIHGHQRPAFRESCPSWLKTLGDRCMSQNDYDRPSAHEILKEIEANMNLLI